MLSLLLYLSPAFPHLPSPPPPHPPTFPPTHPFPFLYYPSFSRPSLPLPPSLPLSPPSPISLYSLPPSPFLSLTFNVVGACGIVGESSSTTTESLQREQQFAQHNPRHHQKQEKQVCNETLVKAQPTPTGFLHNCCAYNFVRNIQLESRHYQYTL